VRGGRGTIPRKKRFGEWVIESQSAIVSLSEMREKSRRTSDTRTHRRAREPKNTKTEKRKKSRKAKGQYWGEGKKNGTSGHLASVEDGKNTLQGKRITRWSRHNSSTSTTKMNNSLGKGLLPPRVVAKGHDVGSREKKALY